MALGAFSLALNQYFQQRRNRAVGICMTITGLGPILYPPLIAHLLSVYGTSGCALILGALCAHIVMAALLLQPVEWHLRAERPDLELADMSAAPAATDAHARPAVTSTATPSSHFGVDHRIDAQSIYGFDHMSMILPPVIPAPSSGQRPVPVLTITSALASRRGGAFERSISHVLQRRTSHDPTATTPSSPAAQHPSAIAHGRRMPFLRWFESGSLASVNLGSSVDVFGERTIGRPAARSPRPTILVPATMHHR